MSTYKNFNKIKIEGFNHRLFFIRTATTAVEAMLGWLMVRPGHPMITCCPVLRRICPVLPLGRRYVPLWRYTGWGWPRSPFILNVQPRQKGRQKQRVKRGFKNKTSTINSMAIAIITICSSQQLSWIGSFHRHNFFEEL